jgi:hypothetical protein
MFDRKPKESNARFVIRNNDVEEGIMAFGSAIEKA